MLDRECRENPEFNKVAEIMRRHQVLFVHAIDPNYVPGYNSLLHDAATWKDKLKIALVFEPALSTSTIHEGDTESNAWAHFGLLLSDGQVEAARASDAGTQAKTRNTRTSVYALPHDTARAIQQAISNRPEGIYNEFVVSHPEIAGLFVIIDSAPRQTASGAFIKRIRNDNIPLEEWQAVAQEFGLPLYIIHDGILYEGQVNDGNLKMGERVNINEIAGKEALSDDKKALLEQSMLVDPPFKMEMPERKYLYAYTQGQELFLYLLFKENPAALTGEAMKLKEMPVSGYNWTPCATSSLDNDIVYLEKKYAPWREYHYYLDHHFSDGRVTLNCLRINKDKRRHLSAELDINLDSDLETSFSYSSLDRYIPIGLNNSACQNGPIGTHHEYLAVMCNVISQQKKLIAQCNADLREQFQVGLGEISYQLRGFAAEAEKYKRYDLAAPALALANSLVSADVAQSVINKRLDKQGRFKIDPSELP